MRSQRGSSRPSSKGIMEGMFSMKQLPKELFENVDLEKELSKPEELVDYYGVLHEWLASPAITQYQTYTPIDVISGTDAASHRNVREEIDLGIRIAYTAYLMPYYLPYASVAWNIPLTLYQKYIQSMVGETTLLATSHTDRLIKGKVDGMRVDGEGQLNGFYVRTPLRLYDGATRKQKFQLPSWHKKKELLNDIVIGPCSVYVMRQNLSHGRYECYIMFRGTSNVTNAIYQYGKKMHNTQAYRVPQYDPVEKEFVTGGSNNRPLFYFYYADMVHDLMPHILQCLRTIGGMERECDRVVVAGHSQGGALAVMFSYVIYHTHFDLWLRLRVVSVACPMFYNHAAARAMERWYAAHNIPNKHVEVLNTDDFVGIQYRLGGAQGIRRSIRGGVKELAKWLNTHGGELDRLTHSTEKNKKKLVTKLREMLKKDPHSVAAIFLKGAIEAQQWHVDVELSHPTRVGYGVEDSSQWGTSALRNKYAGSLRLVLCERFTYWRYDFVGRAHINYWGINFLVGSLPLRMYEDSIYMYYAKHGLERNNDLQVVPIFQDHDLEEAKKRSRRYRRKKKVLANPPSLLFKDFERIHRTFSLSHSMRPPDSGKSSPSE